MVFFIFQRYLVYFSVFTVYGLPFWHILSCLITYFVRFLNIRKYLFVPRRTPIFTIQLRFSINNLILLLCMKLFFIMLL